MARLSKSGFAGCIAALVAVGMAGLAPLPTLASTRHHHRLAHRGYVGGPHYAPGGPAYYHVNRYGYGNYVRGPNGSYGGYPAGSGGARELEINHELKCRYTPESC